MAGPALSSEGLHNAFTHALVGGVASRLGGGAFGEGFVTSAFAYLQNHGPSDADCKNKNCFSLSDDGRKSIQKHESLSPTVYDDGVGIPTVGWGHRVVSADKLVMGDKISIARAEELFDIDIARMVKAVNRAAPVGISQNQFDAAVSLVFNIREGAFEKSKTLAAWRRGDDERLKIEWMDFNRGGGRVMTGLTRRRADELQTFFRK